MITEWLIVAIVTFIAISDLVLIWQRLPSYSRELRRAGQLVSFFPYAWGVFAGHWWSPVPPLLPQDPWWLVVVFLVSIGGQVTFVHWALRRVGVSWHKWLPLLAYPLVGVVSGALCWSLG